MNYTAKYHLPQWEETDRIMRTDFNQMCADMEAGLTKNARDAATATAQAAANAAASLAEAVSDTAAVRAEAKKAQTTADKAVADAAQAQATADAAYCPTKQPYAVGVYTGTMKDQIFTLGFSPQFLIIVCPDERSRGDYSTFACSTYHVDGLELTATGFKVKPTALDSGNQFIPPLLNTTKKTYIYIAFR